MVKIGSLGLDTPFFLAPMEAVNCASFRLVCKRRGASLVYTDMIDVDVFMKFAKEHTKEQALRKFVNPQKEERPLAVQLGGSNLNNVLETIKIVEPASDLIDLNIGCPLGYMLGKKGGAYLMKHPDQLYKLVAEMRKNIEKPFTVKIRSGWDEHSINAVQVAKELEGLGVDAITIHPRTKKQKAQGKADWQLARKVKQALHIPLILSGDVTSPYLAMRAFEHTKCDAIMIARAAMGNPSIFTDLNEWYKERGVPSAEYTKSASRVKKGWEEFVQLYGEIEQRNAFSELQDHALWMARGCKQNKEVSQKILQAKSLDPIMNSLVFE